MINIEDLDVAGSPEHIAPEEYVAPATSGGAGDRKPIKTGRYALQLVDGKLKDQSGGSDRYPVVYRIIGQEPNQALEVQFAVQVQDGDQSGQRAYIRLTSFKRDRKVKVNGVEKSYKTNDILDVIRATGNMNDISTYSGYVTALQDAIAANATFSGYIDAEVWDKASGFKLKGAKNFPVDANGDPLYSFECPQAGPDGTHATVTARPTLSFASPLRG